MLEMMKWQQAVLIHFFSLLKPGWGSAEKVEEAVVLFSLCFHS